MDSKLFSDIVEGLNDVLEFEKGNVKRICSISLNDGRIIRFDEPMSNDELEKKIDEYKRMGLK